MQENYRVSLKFVLQYEGGYVNHPKDPGGPTNYGVTQRVYDAWRVSHGKPKRSVKQITKAEVATIYETQYWDTVKADALPSGVDLCTFDPAVNSGPSRAAKWLQHAVGTPADGIVGIVTCAAAEAQPSRITIDKMCDARMKFLRGLKTWKTFGKGWTRRVEAVRVASLELCEGVG